MSIVRLDHWLTLKDVTITEIVENVKVWLYFVRECNSKNQLVTKHAALSIWVSTHATTTSISRTTCILGLNHHNIIIVVGRRQLIDININSKWATKVKAQCSDILPSITTSLVGAWWVDQTRVSPNRKEMCNLQVSRKVYQQHAKHYLL
jgi:hypothetical protein